MRTKKLDKYIINEIEEDMRKELKEIREEIPIVNQYQPRFSCISNVAPGRSANQIAVFTSN
jgi:hypothetical protein